MSVGNSGCGFNLSPDVWGFLLILAGVLTVVFCPRCAETGASIVLVGATVFKGHGDDGAR